MTTQKETIVKSNALIQAGYRLTIAEQRTLLSAIAQVRRDNEEITDQCVYNVTASALVDLTGCTAQRAYKELADAAERLYERKVRIERGPNGQADGPKGRVTMTRWVQTIDYIPNEGRIELRFAHDILPYLTALHWEFTKYQLQHVSRMKSTHGVRLYELLQQWRQAGEREIGMEDFRYVFGVDGRYAAIKDLKIRVIGPAVRDVNNCSDLRVEWEQRKAGRKVVAIKFTFKPRDESKPNPKLSDTFLAKNARRGETREQAIKRLSAAV